MSSGEAAGIPLLAVEDLHVAYGNAEVLFGVSVTVAPASVLAVLGRNGAGKSTLVHAISGEAPIKSGAVRLDGEDIAGTLPHRIARSGLAQVPEGRGIFRGLTVAETVQLGMRFTVARAERPEAQERVYEIFPPLKDLRHRIAGTLSGGEQQMLALGRALATQPRLLLADEVSLGLAPHAVDRIFEVLAAARAEGMSMVIVEQYIDRALDLADKVVVLNRGQLVWEGEPEDAESAVLGQYLGDTADALEGVARRANVGD